ncbi:hypothetical protein HNY73_020979 [Argiope bruennichi]|uniref:Uncharacterized protein n=1 Tax=Argiope bruennichi TaxID=94029 RepID=A0A8T0E9L8_ARGBR|nr:hypothetical protein HNY73_020979 [Argiope bruennichi]
MVQKETPSNANPNPLPEKSPVKNNSESTNSKTKSIHGSPNPLNISKIEVVPARRRHAEEECPHATPPEPPRDPPVVPQEEVQETPRRAPTRRARAPRRGRSPVIYPLSFSSPPDTDAGIDDRIELRQRRIATLKWLDQLYQRVRDACLLCKVSRAVFDDNMKWLMRRKSRDQLGIDSHALSAKDTISESFVVQVFVSAQERAYANKRKTVLSRDVVWGSWSLWSP